MITLRRGQRRSSENIVPMINVAFLLLVFFLMTAVIMPPEPADITLPAANGDVEGLAEARLTLDANGQLWRDGRENADLSGLQGVSVSLSADRDLSTADLARVLSRLQESGVKRVNLVVASHGS